MTDSAKDRTHPAMGRVASRLTQHVARCGREAGVDVDSVAAWAGLTDEILAERWIPVPIHARFYGRVIEAAEDKLLSLRIGKTLPIGVYEIIVPLMHVSSTVGAAVQHFVRLQKLMTDSARMYGETSTDHDLFGVDVWVKGQLHPLIFGGIAAHWAELIVGLSGGAVTPVRIDLPSSVVELKADYETHFGCEVHFNQRDMLLYFEPGSFAQPCVTPNPGVESLLLEHGLKALATTENDFLTQTVDALLVLRSASARALDVAKILGVSERTLHRRLKARGLRFQQLLDEVLVFSAKNALLSSEPNIDELAFDLGYSDRRAFHRAFVRWTGQTPVRWRASRG